MSGKRQTAVITLGSFQAWVNVNRAVAAELVCRLSQLSLYKNQIQQRDTILEPEGACN